MIVGHGEQRPLGRQGRSVGGDDVAFACTRMRSRAPARSAKRTNVTLDMVLLEISAAFSSVVVPLTTQMRAPISSSALLKPSTASAKKTLPS